jgi:hypothetical protein
VNTRYSHRICPVHTLNRLSDLGTETLPKLTSGSTSTQSCTTTAHALLRPAQARSWLLILSSGLSKLMIEILLPPAARAPLSGPDSRLPQLLTLLLKYWQLYTNKHSYTFWGRESALGTRLYTYNTTLPCISLGIYLSTPFSHCCISQHMPNL